MKKNIKPNLNIIIPVFNTGIFLNRCIASIVEQNFKNTIFRVIIVDDGSTDNSYDIMKSIKNKYHSYDITIHKTLHKGLGHARNFGIRRANGDYLFFVDSDDTLTENSLETINENIMAHNVDILKFQANTITIDLDVNKTLFNSGRIEKCIGIKAFDILLSRNSPKKGIFGPVWLYIYRKNYLTENNLFFHDFRLQEDFLFTPQAIFKANSFISIDKYIYNYIQRQGSIMQNKDFFQRRATDMLHHYDYLSYFFAKNCQDNSLLSKINIFLEQAIVARVKKLNGDFKKDFLSELNKRDINYDNAYKLV